MRTKITSLLIIIVAIATAVPARAGVIRYFLHGGARQLSLGGVSLLDPGTSDFGIGHPALETDRPDAALRLTVEFEDIAHTSEGGNTVSDVNARNEQHELCFTKRAPGRRFSLLAKTQDVNTSASDFKDPSYIGSHGSVESASVGMRFGRFALGGGRVNDSSSISGFSSFLSNDLMDSTKPPTVSSVQDQPEKFLEFAVFPARGVQVFYKKVWGERESSFSVFGKGRNGVDWLLRMPFTLDGGGTSFGFISRISGKWNLSFMNMRNSYGGKDTARVDYFGTPPGFYDPAGIYTTTAATRSAGFEFEYDKSPATRFLFGVRREEFDARLDGRFVSVPTGYYSIDAYLRFKPTLYHLAIEKEDAFSNITFRAGFQFGPMKPEGAATTIGTSCPLLFAFCTVSSQTTTELPYTSVTQRALTLGLEYRFGDFTYSYGFGQMFPRAVRRPDNDTTGGAMDGEGVQAKGNEGSGGRIHLFSIDYAF